MPAQLCVQFLCFMGYVTHAARFWESGFTSSVIQELNCRGVYIAKSLPWHVPSELDFDYNMLDYCIITVGLAIASNPIMSEVISS